MVDTSLSAPRSGDCVEAALLAAHKRGRKFRVVLADSSDRNGRVRCVGMLVRFGFFNSSLVAGAVATSGGARVRALSRAPLSLSRSRVVAARQHRVRVRAVERRGVQDGRSDQGRARLRRNDVQRRLLGARRHGHGRDAGARATRARHRAGAARVCSDVHGGSTLLFCFVQCETYKFCERVQLDSIVVNELLDPEVLVSFVSLSLSLSCLSFR